MGHVKLVVNIRDSNTLPTLITASFFNEVSINFKFDCLATTFKVQMFFDPDNAEHAELAAVTHIHECKLYYVHDQVGTYAIKENKNGKAIFGQTTDELIFTGFMLSQLFSHSSKPSFMEIGGYSKAGVLGDCDFPTKAYPLESVGMSFRQIINQKVLPYFSNPRDGGFKFHIKSSRADSIFEEPIDAEGTPASISAMIKAFTADSDEAIEKTTGPESKNILSYLKELAIQKGLILGTDIFGNLLVNAAYTGNSYLFEVGTPNGIKVVDMSCNFNGQALHSDIEVCGQVPKDGGNMPYAIVSNPLVPVVYRPKVIKLTVGTDNDCLKAAISERGTELKAIPLKITLDRPAINGKFIMPNNTILVKDRICYLYTAEKWFIEEVNYTLNAEGEKCEITAVLPAVYDGSTPKNPFIPSGQNLPRI